jgi:hypothetical protein
MTDHQHRERGYPITGRVRRPRCTQTTDPLSRRRPRRMDIGRLQRSGVGGGRMSQLLSTNPDVSGCSQRDRSRMGRMGRTDLLTENLGPSNTRSPSTPTPPHVGERMTIVKFLDRTSDRDSRRGSESPPEVGHPSRNWLKGGATRAISRALSPSWRWRPRVGCPDTSLRGFVAHRPAWRIFRGVSDASRLAEPVLGGVHERSRDVVTPVGRTMAVRRTTSIRKGKGYVFR